MPPTAPQRTRARPGAGSRSTGRTAKKKAAGETTGLATKDKPVYEDGPFARLMLALFTNRMAKQLGVEKPASWPTYEQFVDVSYEAMRRPTAEEQSAASLSIMLSMLPPDGPKVFQRLFPPAKWSCELNAAITQFVFCWMVGPMTIEERDVPNSWSGDGTTKMKSVVKIERCRYLEVRLALCSHAVAMC